jgi:hypothetical protein
MSIPNEIESQDQYCDDYCDDNYHGKIDIPEDNEMEDNDYPDYQFESCGSFYTIH